MKTVLKASLIALVISSGCTTVVPPPVPDASVVTSAPTPVPPAPQQCTAPPSVSFSAVTRPARVYVAATTCPSPSRFVLFDDGTFVLDYLTLTGGYTGVYTEHDGTVAFAWNANHGQWTAEGTVTDDSLSVHFNLDMQGSDFVDAVYTRMR
jgi:hypothetical protein